MNHLDILDNIDQTLKNDVLETTEGIIYYRDNYPEPSKFKMLINIIIWKKCSIV